MNFNGKVAMVTGASVGIGRACAVRFAKEGAKLVLLDMDFARLEKVKEEVAPYTTEVAIYECDVSNEARVNEVSADALKRFGKIDILVNNAAIWRTWKPFIEVSIEEWKKFIDVNVMGVVYCTRAVLSSMIANRYGRIVNVGSVAGVYGNANMSHYSATKGALISLTKALAKEVIHDGVLVNCVSPGSVSSSKDENMDAYTPSDLCHMGRSGTDNENANLICFIASDESSYISGQNIQIDGCRKKL